MNKLVVISIIFFASINICYSQEKSIPIFISDSIDNYVEKAMTQWNIPGLAIGIVKDGAVVYEKGYGVTDINLKKQVNSNTLFMIGSNTKAFIGTALALLEYEKKCKLEDKVINYIPEFRLYDTSLSARVNLIDIVTHRLGFETFQGDFMYFDSDFTNQEMLKAIGKVKPLFDFRSKYGYCNAGYFVAGLCIKEITKKSWSEYLKERIFDPCNMNRTVTRVSEITNDTNKCTAHTFINHKLTTIPYGGLDLLGPAASMSASINNMNKWTRMLLDSGRVEGSAVIPQEVIDRSRKPEMHIGYSSHKFNRSNFRLYGLGWSLKDYEGYKVVSHTGGVHGFVSSVTLVPEINLGVVVLTNTDQNWVYDALNVEIVDSYLNLPYRNYSNEYLKIFKRIHKKDSTELAQLIDSTKIKIKPPISLKNFEGTYTNEAYGNINLIAEKDVLKASFQYHKDLSAELKYIGNNRFLCTYSNPSQGIEVFPFTIKDKKVESFELSVEDFLEFTTYTFEKK